MTQSRNSSSGESGPSMPKSPWPTLRGAIIDAATISARVPSWRHYGEIYLVKVGSLVLALVDPQETLNCLATGKHVFPEKG